MMQERRLRTLGNRHGMSSEDCEETITCELDHSPLLMLFKKLFRRGTGIRVGSLSELYGKDTVGRIVRF